MSNATSRTTKPSRAGRMHVARVTRRTVGGLIILAGAAIGIFQASAGQGVRTTSDKAATAASPSVELTLDTALTSIGGSR